MSDVCILQEQGSDCLGLGGTYLSEEDQNRYNDQYNKNKEDEEMKKAGEPTAR